MKSRPDFEARYGFVAVMDIKLGKRRSLIKRLADDPVYMEKHGFIRIEKPEPLKVDFSDPQSVYEAIGEPKALEVYGTRIETKCKPLEQIEGEINTAIKKRGRPKKQK